MSCSTSLVKDTPPSGEPWCNDMKIPAMHGKLAKSNEASICEWKSPIGRECVELEYVVNTHINTIYKLYLIKFWHTWHTGIHLQETGNNTLSKNPHGLYSWKEGPSAQTLFPTNAVDLMLCIRQTSHTVFPLRVVKTWTVWKLINEIRPQFTCVSPERRG